MTAETREGEPALVSLTDIRDAAERIRDKVLRTPLVSLVGCDPDRPLWLKAECLQPTGAFKMRGAYNAILQRIDEARRSGVVASSSGNHARAVAWVGHELGLAVTVAMPAAAAQVKVAAVRALGAEVVIVGAHERDSRAREIAAELGAVLVPPYDHPAVLAGQGTAGLEIVEDLPDVDVVLVPVSGGGLLGGIATAVKSLSPNTVVIGVEPELAGDAAESFRRGERVEWSAEDTYRTIADGLRTTSVGVVPWRQIHRYVDDIITVTEDEIRAAVRAIAERARLVAEPSGAVSAAAYLSHAGQLPRSGRFVAVVSGGNVAMDAYGRLLLD